MADFDEHLNSAWWVLRIGLGVGPIITGIDKYFNKLADWGMYLSPLATKLVPINATTFMHIVGVVEIAAGVVVLSKWTKYGAYIVMAWVLGIAANLLTTGMFNDLAMREGPSIFSALQEQLGLRLEPTKAAVGFLIVQHVERPTAN